MPDNSLSARTSYIPALDGLRGIAILLVMLRHFVTMPATRVAELPLTFAASAGWTGVELFFALSGFLITGILIDSRGAPHYARSFYARRALRILPLYLAVVACLTVALPLIARADPHGARAFASVRWLYWCHATNLLVARTNDWLAAPFDTGHFWSLAVEEQFYLCWPLLVAACPPRRLFAVCLGIAAASAVARAAAVALGAAPLAVYVLTPTHLDAIALGGALAAARRSPDALRAARRVDESLARAPLGLWIVLGLAALLVLWTLDPSGNPETPLTQAAGAPLVAIGAVLVLSAALDAPADSPLGRVLTARALRTTGRYSYGLYVLHYPAFYALNRAGLGLRAAVHWFPPPGGSALPAQLIVLAMATCLSFSAAWASWHALEQPFLRLKRHVPRPAPHPIHPARGRVETPAGGGPHHRVTT